MRLEGENTGAVLGQGRPDPRALFSPGYFFITWSDELFATDTGEVHQVHFLTRGVVAFYTGRKQLPFLRRWEADLVEIRFRGHKGHQCQAGNVLL